MLEQFLSRSSSQDHWHMMTFGLGVGREILGISRSIQLVRQPGLLQAPQPVYFYRLVMSKQR